MSDSDTPPVVSTTTITEDTITQVVTAGRQGYRTTEFWLHVVALLVGVYLFFKGKDELAALLIGLSGFSYNVSRGIAKKAAVLLLALTITTGCSTPGYVKASEVKGLVDAVTLRHDAYVDADGTLDEEHKASYKRSAALIRMTVDEAVASGNAKAPASGASK